MSKSILLIVNPKAGRAKSKKYIETILSYLKANDYDPDIEYTTVKRNATQIIKEKGVKGDKIIVWGGDGTLTETINGLEEIKKNPAIAFIPTGTTNDFARTLKVSFKELDVSKYINNYKVYQVDMGKIDNACFNYTVSMGIFSKSSYQTSRKWKNRVGKIAYYFNGFKELFTYKTNKLKITTKDQTYEGDFLYAGVSNSKYIGGFPVFRKVDISLNDGKFEVIIARKPRNKFSTLILVIKMLTGFIKDKNIIFFKSSEIEIDAPQGIDLSIDGEYGGNRKHFKITNIQKKTNYLIP